MIKTSALFSILFLTSSIVSCRSPEECFYKLSVDSDAYELYGTDALGRVFNKRFSEYRKDPIFSPPLVKGPEMYFSESCNFLDTENYVDKEFSDVEYPYNLRQIDFAEYDKFFAERSK